MNTWCRQFLAGSLAALAFAAAAAPPVPLPGHRVTELTATLDPREQQALAAELQRIEAETGARVLVLIIDSLDGEEISAYATRVFDAWKPGRAGVDDGVLIVLAKTERRVRIEVGRGLEGAIPDVVTHRIAANTMIPAFGQGEFAKGLTDAAREIGRLVASEGRSDPSPRDRFVASEPAPASSTGTPWYFFPLLALLVSIAVGLVIRRRPGDAAPFFAPRPLTDKERRFLDELATAKRIPDATRVESWPSSTSSASFRFDAGSGTGFSADSGSGAGAGANTYDAGSSAGTSAGAGSDTTY